jgi:hypothetical protein
MEPTIRNFPDLEFVVKVIPGEYHADYAIYEILGTHADGSITYNKAGADSTCESVDTIEEAQVFAHGSVKWDGCSNWHFDITDDCMLHGCGREDLLKLGKILELCWIMTKEFCSGWNADVAEG